MRSLLFRQFKRVIIVTLLYGSLPTACGLPPTRGFERTVFRQYLAQAGDKIGCHFVVESVGQPDFLNNPILDAMVNVGDGNLRTLDELISFLSKNISIVWETGKEKVKISLLLDRVSGEKSIVRIRDARLATVKNYALDQKISLQYEGTPDGLMDKISSLNPLVQKQKVFPVGAGPIVVDNQTRVKVDAQNKAIRDILADSIATDGYSRIIWSSFTNGKDDSPSVTVQYHGPRIK